MHVLLLPPLPLPPLLLRAPLLLLLGEHGGVARWVLVLGLGDGPLVAAAAGPAHQPGRVVASIEGRLLLALVARLGGAVPLGVERGEREGEERRRRRRGGGGGGEWAPLIVAAAPLALATDEGGRQLAELAAGGFSM